MRSFFAAVLVLLGAVAVAVSVPAVWASSMASSSQRFVEALTPIAADPGVQSLVAEQVSAQVTARLNRAAAGAPPSVRRLAERLVQETVEGYVRSPAFADLWPAMVRSAHDGLEDVLEGPSGSPMTIDLTPVVAQIRSQLVAEGLTVASSVRTDGVVLTVSDVGRLAALRPYAQPLERASLALPLVGGFLLLLGFAVARRRLWAIGWAALLAAAVTAAEYGLLGAAKAKVVADLVPDVLPAGSRAVVYDAVADDLRGWLLVAFAIAVGVLVLAIVFAALGRARRLAAA